jgi:glycosyltransferase involved in cell wall biosynthesis
VTPKVTVLLAVHDGEPYVRQALESVLNQTFADFELLVVDDASTDRSVQIVESLADDRLRLLRNERNVGQVPSLNRGLLEARGEYVARMDADDVCHPSRLERQVAVLDAEPRVGLVGSWLLLIDERGRRVGGLREPLDDFAGYVYATLIMRVYVAHSAAMYRREAVLELGGYDESTGPSEDKDLWRRLLLDRWDARNVRAPLVSYRLHDKQLSQTRSAYQREVDGESQDRFLAALAPDVPVHPLRLLLAASPAFWREDGEAARQAVTPVLAGATERLGLSADESRMLEQLVARRIVRVAARRAWRRDARALIGDAMRRLEPAGRATASQAFLLEPLGEALRVSGHRAGRSGGLARVRARTRRLRIVRRLYGKVVGGG